MARQPTKPADEARQIDLVPGPTPIPRKQTCASIAQEQDEALRRRCAKKVNRLSCQCSACSTDDRYPVLSSSSDTPLVNTAYNGMGGFLTGGTDTHWQVGLGDPTGPASVASWIPAFVFHNSAWVPSPFNNANWISYFADSAQGGDNVDAYFRYTFNLASSIDPATFVLDMSFYADNRVWEIYVNGLPQSTMPNGTGVLPQFPNSPASEYQTEGFIKGSEAHIKLDNSWRPCENEIIVYVKSGPGYLGFLAQNAAEINPAETGCDCHCDCVDVQFPSIKPCISVSWGDSVCDCLETNDVEVLCITVCNCYANVTFTDLSIGQILVTDLAGQPVATLPDGTPSVQVIPSGPICFDDLGPCVEKDHPSCVSRELVLYTRGAIGKSYKLIFRGICFKVCLEYQEWQCFTMKLCQD
jgi:hypothetical protein